jgi:hypothetical protein
MGDGCLAMEKMVGVTHDLPNSIQLWASQKFQGN